MLGKRNRRAASLVCACVVIVASLLGCDDKRHEANARARARSEAQEMARTKDAMIRRVNAIVTTIGDVEQRLSEQKSRIEADKEAFEIARLNAQRSYESGQMHDFFTWQRIGREKQQNIAAAVERVERTFVVLCSDADSQLKTVRWVSGQDETNHRQNVQQKLNELEQSLVEFSRTCEGLADQKWLKYSE